MAQTFRHPEILEIARRDGMVTVEGLAARFDVTHQTIRRDLSDLAAMGKLERVHGGAIPAAGTVNIEYEARRALNHTGKAAIARACAACIPSASAVCLNIGTTTEAVAGDLLTHAGLTVVTNNMNVARILSGNPGCRVIVTGGVLRDADGGLLGPLASDAIRQFKFDIAVIGCSAIDRDGDLLDFDVEEVRISQAIVAQSRQVFLVADRSKFGRSAPARIGSLAQVDRLFTDLALTSELSARCDGWGTRIVVCEG